MSKTPLATAAKTGAKSAAKRTAVSLFSILAIFGSIGALVWAFSGPPPGCTPSSCPANPFKVDFTNSRVGIGLGTKTPTTKLEVGGTITATGGGVRADWVTASGAIKSGSDIIAKNKVQAQTVTATGAITAGGKVTGKELCIGSDCKTEWPSASSTPVALAGEYQVGPMVWSGVIENNAVKTQMEAFTLCKALGNWWRLPSSNDWIVATSFAGGSFKLATILHLTEDSYLTADNTLFDVKSTTNYSIENHETPYEYFAPDAYDTYRRIIHRGPYSNTVRCVRTE